MNQKIIISFCLAAAFSLTVLGGTASVSKETAAEEETMTLMNCNFENGLSGWAGRGSASVAVSKETANGGSSSLYVTKRASAWNGAVVDLGSDFSGGSTYGFEAYVKQDQGSASENFKLSLQYTDANGNINYDAIAEGSVSKGEWTKLSNSSYTIPAGASSLLFYIETVDSTIDFYVDDVNITGTSAAAVAVKPVNKNIRGDVNGNGVIDTFDVVRIRQLASMEAPTSAQLSRGDIDGDKVINETDIGLLSDYVLGKITDFPAKQSSGSGEGRYDFPKSYDFAPVSALKSTSDLADPYIFLDGRTVDTPDDWWERASEIRCMYEYYMYGTWRDGSDEEVSYNISGNSMTISVKRLSTGKKSSFKVILNLPKTVRHEGGAPVIVGMHKNIAESTATSNGYAVITMDADGVLSAPGTAADSNQHTGAFYDLYPYGQSWEEQTGVLMAWSWGCSKVLDALYAGAAQELNINPDSSIVTGVSRYGKATAVCGAFDTRFKMCAPSCSGAGGLALYRYMSKGKTYDFSSVGGSARYTYDDNEPLGSLQASGEQGWFNHRFREFRDPNQIPMDQHMLGSLCCDPDRYLFIIGSCQDENWVNAPSVWMSYVAMQNVFDFMGIKDHVAVNMHKSGHAVLAEDVQKMIQYFDYHVYDITPSINLDTVHTSVFALPQNHDTYEDKMTAKWIH